MMKGAPPTKHQNVETVSIAIRRVDQRGREIEQRWGIGRLPSLVPIEIAEKFWSQRRKFSAAVFDIDPNEARKHGDAMLRAYDKLEELATAAGAQPMPPEQWEFETPDGLVVLVRDIADTGRVELGGRKAQVWSLDEVASVIRAHPTLAALKDAFPGATVESTRPPLEAKTALNDHLLDLPF